MRLKAEGITVDADQFEASLVSARAAMDAFEEAWASLETDEVAVVGAGGAIMTIPGLVYELNRTMDLAADFGSIDAGVKKTGTGGPVTLEDLNPPTDKAFYVIGVSVP